LSERRGSSVLESLVVLESSWSEMIGDDEAAWL
jgi:hypothetical protein